MKMHLLAAAAIVSGLGAVAMIPSASAAIVCSGDTCWHTHAVYHYPPAAGVIVHGDHWRWGHDAHYRWHEHEGRGYWHGGDWVAF